MLALLLCAWGADAYLLSPRTQLPRSRGRPPVACAEVAATADEGGPLAGPWWDAFCEEANLEADALGLSVARLSFSGGTLSVCASGGGVDDLQQLNKHLSGYIDAQSEDDTVDALPPFLLEVSSPGLSSVLTKDIDFTVFKGFPVTATTTEPFKGKTKWEGTLMGRDDESVSINLKGRTQKIPRGIVEEVRLPSSKAEAGDPYNSST